MRKPRVAALPPELLELQARWLEAPRPSQDELYAKEFAPLFVPLFAALPLHGAPKGLRRPKALVSILGLSWQPVALMAAWASPGSMLLVGTQESLGRTDWGEAPVDIVARLGRVPRERIRTRQVTEHGELDIYRHVRGFVEDAGLRPRDVFVDPTGGKKSMLVAGSLAAFLLGTPVVYVDYAAYHGPRRIPIAGTEYPRIVEKPLEVFGDLEFERIGQAFQGGEYGEAERLAEQVARRL